MSNYVTTSTNNIDVLSYKRINHYKQASEEFRTCLSRDVMRKVVMSEISSTPIKSSSIAGAFFSWYYINSDEPVTSAMYLDNRQKIIRCDDLVRGICANASGCAYLLSDGLEKCGADSVLISANFGLHNMQPIPEIVADFCLLHQSCLEKEINIVDIILTERFDYVSLLDFFG